MIVSKVAVPFSEVGLRMVGLVLYSSPPLTLSFRRLNKLQRPPYRPDVNAGD